MLYICANCAKFRFGSWGLKNSQKLRFSHPTGRAFAKNFSLRSAFALLGIMSIFFWVRIEAACYLFLVLRFAASADACFRLLIRVKCSPPGVGLRFVSFPPGTRNLVSQRKLHFIIRIFAHRFFFALPRYVCIA